MSRRHVLDDVEMRVSQLSLKYFESKVKQVIQTLPSIFLEKMKNVEVIIEEYPDTETLESLGIQSPWELLGLYSGAPLTHQSFFSPVTLPQRIFLYRQPIIHAALPGSDVDRVIREVLIHEIGHHFGFDDKELEEIMGNSR